MTFGDAKKKLLLDFAISRRAIFEAERLEYVLLGLDVGNTCAFVESFALVSCDFLQNNFFYFFF